MEGSASKTTTATRDRQASTALTISTNNSVLCAEEARELKLDECKAAAHTLALAFAEDEVARYFVDTPDLAHWTERQKWDLHLSIIEYITYIHCICGTVTTVGENYGCVALWLPPGKNADSLLSQLRSGLWRLHYKLSREGRARFFKEFMPLLHDTKLSVLGPQHDADSYYLVYIGTKPGNQGKGLARQNMQWGMGRADREGKLCYLESSNFVNLKIYGRMGFQVRRQIRLVRNVSVPPRENGKPRDITGSGEEEAAKKTKNNNKKKGEIVLDIMVRDPILENQGN